jgi:hypothetical protein
LYACEQCFKGSDWVPDECQPGHNLVMNFISGGVISALADFQCVPDCNHPDHLCDPGFCCQENIFLPGSNLCLPCPSSTPTNTPTPSSTPNPTPTPPPPTATICTPYANCNGSCGIDDGCGNTCPCPSGYYCDNYTCVPSVTPTYYPKLFRNGFMEINW